MKTFTITADNNIAVHSSKKAARETGEPVFANEVQLAELIGSDTKRLVEIWNSLTGVKPVTKFANRKAATERIWKALQTLGEAPAPVAQEPVAAEQPPEIAPAASEPAIEQIAAAAEIDTALPAEVSDTTSQPPETQAVAGNGQ